MIQYIMLRRTGSARPATTRVRRHAQVKVAEHVLTGHKVAIKILNRRKIKQMDMDEKGATRVIRAAWHAPLPTQHGQKINVCVLMCA